MFGYSSGAVDGAAHQMLTCSMRQGELCKKYVLPVNGRWEGIGSVGKGSVNGSARGAMSKWGGK